MKYLCDIDMDNDIQRDIKLQKYCENSIKYPITKSEIPNGTKCVVVKAEKIQICPYCVTDRCLKFGGRLITTEKLNGVYVHKRNNKCLNVYPKGFKFTDIEILGMEEI